MEYLRKAEARRMPGASKDIGMNRKQYDEPKGDPGRGRPISGEPDAVKVARPVRRGLRHEVAYVFVVLE